MTIKMLRSEVTGVTFKVVKTADDVVAEGEEVLVLESMKMEIPVESRWTGEVLEILVAEGDAVATGQELVRIRIASGGA